MQRVDIQSFAFLVLAYNHESYILEHLESIKFLVQAYADDVAVDLIINDDCSRDNTSFLVDQWLHVNESLFRHVKRLFNPQNIGTCASLSNMLEHVVADRCKITAGDDVYSFENIFRLTQCRPDVALVSGRPLYLLDAVLGDNKWSNMLVTATQVIYKNKSLLYRFKHFSLNLAPNILYATDCLSHPKVLDYLRRFDLTEDWPLQIAIARQFPSRRFELIDEVLVYYRRTPGSAFIVASERVVDDKLRIYEDLIRQETSCLEKLRLIGRKTGFKLQGCFLGGILNIDFFFFVFSFAKRSIKIFILSRKLVLRVASHQCHYDFIRSSAKSFVALTE